MFKKILLTCTMVLFACLAFSQGHTVKGIVRVQNGVPLPGVSITLQAAANNTIADSTSVTDSSKIKMDSVQNTAPLNSLVTVTDSLGVFLFSAVQSGVYRLSASSIGFAPNSREIRVDSVDVIVDTIDLVFSEDILSSVTVTSSVAPVVQKGDTVQFSASQFKVNRDATAEELAKKMPGITVENGQVKSNGENVQKVTIDGRELFGDDATAALRNLPAEIIDKIQVFDRLSDQAQFTGFDDGSSTKGINIITKANMRNGQFGRIFTGYGTDDRYQAGGNATFLHDNRKISLVGNFNNVNQQNFASQDLLGVTSSGGGRGGGGRGGGRGGGGNNSNFLVGQQSGINATNAAGINYADDWGKKINVSASYFFNNANNSSNESVNRQYFLDGISSYNQQTIATSRNTNHRFSMRFEYTIDSSNQLIITPSLGIQNNNSFRNVTTSFYDPATALLTGKTDNTNNSARTGYDFNNTILWRHSFAKKGRTFSANLNTSSNNRTGDVYTNLFDTTFTGTTYTDSVSKRLTDQVSSGYQLSANLVYTEPLGANSQLQFNYNPRYSKNKANQQAYQYDDSVGKYSTFDPLLSSKFDNVYTSHSIGTAYRYGTRDNQISFGVNLQRARLESDQAFPRSLRVDKTFDNILPNAMVRLKLSPKSNVRIMYRANTNQPSVTQLQDVYDITNFPFVTAGNPQLAQQYSHVISTRYTYTNSPKGILFVGNVFLQTANNYVTNATYVAQNDSLLTPDITLKRGQQLTKPVNLDGYLNLRSFVNFAVPLKFMKSSINFNGGVSYSKLPGIINNAKNISKNITYTGGAVVASNISQYIDFTLSYSANFNTIRNDLQPNLNTNYFSHVAGLQFNLLSKSGWFFQNDLNNQLYSGLSAGFNQSYFLWNMSAGKKFLKDQKGELKVSVFDVLKQNRSIVRNVEDTYVEDVRNQVLQQYFMFTFTYNLRTFGGVAAAPANANRRQRM